jgi:PAS domain S-box-containing protein
MKDLRNLEGPALGYQPRLLDILFDRMPMGIAILDRELRVRRFNPTWAECVARYSPGSTGRVVPGVSLLELTPGNEAAVRAVFEPVLAGEQVHQEDFRLEIGGVVSYWDAGITPIIENGKVVGILHVITDMTERKQAEEVLQASERFRLLVMHIPDVIWTTDCEGKTTFISPNVEQVYGFTPEEICQAGSRLWLERIHPEDLERVREAYESLFARNEMFDVEYRIQRKDGRWIWLYDRAIATYEKDGVMYADGMFSDITERRRAGEELRAGRDFISAVLDTVGALVVVLDREGRIVRFNRACERTTGYSFDEVKGKLLWDLFLVPEEVEPVKAVFEELQAGLFPNEYENYWATKDGGRRLIAWSNTALLGADGAVEYVIGTGIDVTERKQAESQRDATLEALKKAHGDLELRVAERTTELQEANESLQEEIAKRRRVEEALRESEGHMRSLMESARSYAVYRIAVDPTNPFLARVVLASPSMKDLLSIPDLHDFATWFDNIHPDDLARIVEANRCSLETSVPFDQQFRVFNEGRGEWAWVHVRSTPVLDDEGRLTHFNGLVADVTEQKRAEEEIRRQNEYLAALHETALGVVSRLDTADLLEAIVERAVHLVGATYGFVYLVRPGTDEIEVKVGTGPYRQYVGRRLKKGEGLSGAIWQLGQPLAVENYQAWPDRSLQFEGIPFGPAMGTPLMSGAEVVGVIGVAHPSSAPPFRQDEMDLITRFSHLASITLDNAHLHTSLQEELAERVRAEEALQALVEFEDAIARISGSFVNLAPEQVDDGIQRALQTIGMAYHVERACVFQFSGDRTRMDCTHEWCADGIEPQIHKMKGVPISVMGWTAERIMRLEVVQIQNGLDLPAEASGERAELQSLGLHSRIVVPMVYRGVPVGFVGFDAARDRQWTEQSLKLQVIGDIFVNALEHKRAQAIQDGQRQFLELLATGGTFSETLHTLLRIIEEQWPGMLGLILLLDEDGNHLHIGAAVSLPEDYIQSIEGLEIGPMVGSCGTACYRRERVIVEDTATDPRWDGLRDLALCYGLRACWSEPVFSPDGQVVGTFAMYYRQPRAPTEAELRTIEMGAHLVGVAIEHERAQQALQEAYQTLEQRVQERTRELAALNAIAAVVSRSLDLKGIMSDALDKTLEVMGMDLGVAYRLEGGEDPAERSLLNVMAHRGISTELARQVDPLPLWGSMIEKAAAVEQPVVWQVADYPNVALKQAMEEEGVRLGVSVPLLVKERLVGALVLAARDMRTFVPEELSLLAAIGQQIGIAVENARLYEQAEQAAVITERNRLARELHDSVTQALYSVTLYAEAAAILLTDGKNLEAADHLRELRDTAQEALREMRLLIFELRPLALEKIGLVAALQTRLEAVEGRGGMQTELQVEGAPNAERLPFAVQEELYHIAQEALNNVLKHAHAQRVRVHLQFSDTVTCLEVWDDGVGFESERARERGGLGLRGMEERGQRIGGQLHIESALGKGTRVSIKVPTGYSESLGTAQFLNSQRAGGMK